jgi:NTE family protein
MASVNRKTVTLALQGGGSHGAFTWGVLDRLLEDERLTIEGISGASAGAMNGLALAHGYMTGGHEGARAALKMFWEAVASRAPLSHLPEFASAATANNTQAKVSPSVRASLRMLRYFSARQLNPLDLNPLRELLNEQIDFERMRTECPIKLYIAATAVQSGRLKLFENAELSVDALLASSCLPFFNQAVQIDGVAYWDGGFTANPPLFPLIDGCAARDLIAVVLQPLERAEVPTKPDEIRERLTEISLAAPFFTELQRVTTAEQQAKGQGASERRVNRLKLHLIDSQLLMSQLGTHSKLNAHPSFIGRLFDNGRERADLWLKENFSAIGRQSSWKMAA